MIRYIIFLSPFQSATHTLNIFVKHGKTFQQTVCLFFIYIIIVELPYKPDKLIDGEEICPEIIPNKKSTRPVSIFGTIIGPRKMKLVRISSSSPESKKFSNIIYGIMLQHKR